MAVQSTFYTPDGTLNKFPSTKYIASKTHVAVFYQEVGLTWTQLNTGDYDLINNAIVFNVAPAAGQANGLEVRVADSPSELTDSPSDISTVATISGEIVTVAGISTQVVAVANNSSNVTAVGSNIANVSSVATNMTDIVSVAANEVDIDTVAISIANVQTVATNVADVNTVATNIIDVQNAYEDSLTAKEYATNPENDTVYDYRNAVETTDYSAKHHALKAAASALSIDPAVLLHTIGYGGADPVTYTQTQIDAIPRGRKNLLINGRKLINQRGLSGGRKQVVLNTKNLGGNHTISWVGAATVTIKEATTLAASDALTTWDIALVTGGTSGTTVTLTAGKYVHVEFSTTDWDFALLENGSVATNYPILEDFDDEYLSYYEESDTETISANGIQTSSGNEAVDAICPFKTIMRVTPLIKVLNFSTLAINEIRDIASGAAVSATVTSSGKTALRVTNTGATIDQRRYGFKWVANAEIFNADDGVGIQYCEDRWYKNLP